MKNIKSICKFKNILKVVLFINLSYFSLKDYVKEEIKEYCQLDYEKSYYAFGIFIKEVLNAIQL